MSRSLENKYRQQLHEIEDHISLLTKISAPQKWYYDNQKFDTFEKLKEYIEKRR